ncbi:hypothetical protein A5N83_08425 [Rhodococcus sp. 1139]|nr:hypothetical protein A5N83_08425 [Rhodococcus sp. 1139]
MIGHRVFSLQIELVALLKNHAVAVLIGVATRPQFQDEWSYTTLLDSTLTMSITVNCDACGTTREVPANYLSSCSVVRSAIEPGGHIPSTRTTARIALQ